MTVRQKSPYCFTQWVLPRHDLRPSGRPRRRAGRDSVVRHLGADDRSSTRVRLVDGALRCLARQGIAKTTVDDIARAAGLSRATAYRTFPRGKDGILAAVVETEVARLFSSLAVVMGEAERPRGRAGRRHGRVGPPAARRTGALAYLLAHEPGAVLPYLTFGGFDQVMLVAERPGRSVLRPLARARAGLPGRGVGRAHRAWPTARTRRRTPT